MKYDNDLSNQSPIFRGAQRGRGWHFRGDWDLFMEEDSNGPLPLRHEIPLVGGAKSCQSGEMT